MQPVCMCFVDLCSSGVLWVGYFWSMSYQSLYNQCQSLICVAGSKLDSFPVSVGLCPGCAYEFSP